MKKRLAIIAIPDIINAAEHKVLLHSCCAPCSSAILEFFIENGIKPTVFYCNPNIYPLEEYVHRRNEIKKHLEILKIPFVEDTYNHTEWLEFVKGHENEPERGSRCMLCFKFRMLRAAKYAQRHGYKVFTTTLASSRWKNLTQINEAGTWASSIVNSEETNNQILFWDQNWRKGGLQERRNELLRQYDFYNQLYCGCEFSIRKDEE